MTNKMTLLKMLAFSCPIALWAIEPPQRFMLDQAAVVAAAQAVTAEKYPEANCVSVDSRMLEVFQKDGTSVVWDDDYSKILTEAGRRAGSTYDLSFNRHYGTSFVYRAEILKPDGRVVSIAADEYSRVMTDPSQMGSNICDPNDMVLSLSLPGLEIGDLYHLVTCRRTSIARMPNTWSTYAFFEATQPIVRRVYSISAPPDCPILHKPLRAPLTNAVAYAEARQPDGRTLHTWTVTNVPCMFPEPNMPPLHTQVQRLLLSTIKDWRTVSRWYWELCQPALSKTTPEMKSLVETLVAGSASREDKIRRIFKFVSQNIRYMGITAEEDSPGYAPHEVSLTFNNRYGVCRDKAALLIAMLRMAGFPAYPVLINASAKMDPDVPQPFFNHTITAVEKPGGGYMLFDPTNESTRDLFPAYLCNRSYLVARPDGETLLVSEVYPAEKNLTRISTEGKLDATGALFLKTKIAFEGINDNAYRGYFLQQKTEERRKFFENMLQNWLSGAEVIECAITPEDLQDTEKPLTVTLSSRVPEFPVLGKGCALASMPWLGANIGYADSILGQTGLKERRYTLETGITCGIEEQVTLDVSAGLGAIQTLPQAVHIDRAGVGFVMNQSMTNGVLTGHRNYLVKTSEFRPPDYLELKKVLKEIESAGNHCPIFEAKDTLAPELEWLTLETDSRITNPHVWTTTETMSKRILTYAGVKRGSELTFNYNPAWQNFELVSATVSNVDGTVHSVTPKEINIMDAAWVGSAPRYPAEKTLVVNMPGVQTGSVITVTWRTSQTNAYFYSTCLPFGQAEPVLRQTYRLTYPRTLEPSIQKLHFDKVNCTTETNDLSVVFTCNAFRQAGMLTEENLPPPHLFKPTLFVSFGDWQKHARRIRLAIDAVSKTDTAARQRARALVKRVEDPRSRILSIRDEVMRSVRSVDSSFLNLPLDCLSTPDRTLADQYGHPADRAILLAAMLKAVGFDAEILFVSNNTTHYPASYQPYHDVPQLGFYSNPLVAVLHKGITYYLNEGDQYDELGVSNLDYAPALTLSGKTTTLAVADRFRNRARDSMTIDLDAHGAAVITVTNWFFGTMAGRCRQGYDEVLPEDRRRHHLELVGGISKSAEPASDLITETKAYPCYQTFKVIAADYAAIDGSAFTVPLPSIAGALFPVTSEVRESPFFFAGANPSEYICRIILPLGYTDIPLLPESKCWALPYGLGTLDYTVTVNTHADTRREVCITSTAKRFSGEAPKEACPLLLEYNRRITHPSVRTIMAKRPVAP